MKKALWFSRHAPTAAQLTEIAAMGYEIAAQDDGLRLGAMNLADDGDLNAVLSALLRLAAQHEAEACFGVFAVPVQAAIVCDLRHGCGGYDAAGVHYDSGRSAFLEGRGIPCYAAWNVQRSQEGGKPTFEHHRWCCVGALSDAALRWVAAYAPRERTAVAHTLRGVVGSLASDE